jgi:hypothetical protein
MIYKLLLLLVSLSFSKGYVLTDSVVAQGVISFIPDAPVVKEIVPRVVLDTTPMAPDVRFYFDNIPISQQSSSHGQIPLFLKKAVNYLAGISENDIPQEMNILPFVLQSKGYRIFRLHGLQTRPAQLLIANGLPLMIEMQRIEGYNDPLNDKLFIQIGGNTHAVKMPMKNPVTRQLYYNVIKGYSPVEGSSVLNIKKGDLDNLTVLYTYDEYAFRIHHSTDLKKELMAMQRIVNGYQDANLNQVMGINAVYLIVPKIMDKKALKAKLDDIYETMPFKFKIPIVEEVDIQPY